MAEKSWIQESSNIRTKVSKYFQILFLISLHNSYIKTNVVIFEIYHQLTVLYLREWLLFNANSAIFQL
jgi:hypothetical protein